MSKQGTIPVDRDIKKEARSNYTEHNLILQCQKSITEDHKLICSPLKSTETEQEFIEFYENQSPTDYIIQNKEKNKHTEENPTKSISTAIMLTLISGFSWSFAFGLLYFLYDYASIPDFIWNSKMTFVCVLLLGFTIGFTLILYRLWKK